MSENHPPVDHQHVSISKPSPLEISSTAIDAQCVRVKQEIYKLKPLLEAHSHEQNRAQALAHLQTAYDAFQTLQTFINSR